MLQETFPVGKGKPFSSRPDNTPHTINIYNPLTLNIVNDCCQSYCKTTVIILAILRVVDPPTTLRVGGIVTKSYMCHPLIFVCSYVPLPRNPFARRTPRKKDKAYSSCMKCDTGSLKKDLRTRRYTYIFTCSMTTALIIAPLGIESPSPRSTKFHHSLSHHRTR